MNTEYPPPGNGNQRVPLFVRGFWARQFGYSITVRQRVFDASLSLFLAGPLLLLLGDNIRLGAYEWANAIIIGLNTISILICCVSRTVRERFSSILCATTMSAVLLYLSGLYSYIAPLVYAARLQLLDLYPGEVRYFFLVVFLSISCALFISVRTTWRLWHMSMDRNRPRHITGVILITLTFLSLPYLYSIYVQNRLDQDVSSLIGGQELTDEVRDRLRGWEEHLDRIVVSYAWAEDKAIKDSLAQSYKRITGYDIESRLLQLNREGVGNSKDDEK